MAEFQFSHIETYARTVSKLSRNSSVRTCYDILAEASRVKEHCRHVISPSPPELLDGMAIDELAKNLNTLIEKEMTKVVLGGEEKTRAVRKDAHVLLAAVYSYPSLSEHCELDEIKPFFMDCIEFHKEKFGSVQSAVLHTDEQYLHIHVYTLSANARRLHPGHIAKELNKREAEPIKASEAYKKAMRLFQDNFYHSVSEKYGLARIGPKRKRIQPELFQQAKQATANELREWAEAEQSKIKKKHQEELERAERLHQEKLLETEREYLQSKEEYDLMVEIQKEKIQRNETIYEGLIDQIGTVSDILIHNQELIAEIDSYRQRIEEYEDDYGPR
jgi:hypothetical protein